jgi:hypothetical protein
MSERYEPGQLLRGAANWPGPTHRVIGYDDDRLCLVQIDEHRCRTGLPFFATDNARLTPWPPSCPITEPTTLIVSSNGYIGTKGFATNDPGERSITLHPPGIALISIHRAERDHWGYYTWTDR